MTDLLKDIRDHLEGSTSIADAFGQHIYPGSIPQGVKFEQAIAMYDISIDPVMHLGGESGTHETNITIDIWTDGVGGRKRCHDLRELVRNRLNGYRGQFGTGCSGTALMIRNNLTPADPIDGSSLHRWRAGMDFHVTHSADVPTLT